jgi:hypothetical protein
MRALVGAQRAGTMHDSPWPDKEKARDLAAPRSCGADENRQAFMIATERVFR